MPRTTRFISRLEWLERREVPSVSNGSQHSASIPENSEGLTHPSDSPITKPADSDREPGDAAEETLFTTTTSLPPVVFGDGNFDALPVGSKFVIASGLRSGEARLYGFDANGNLIDTGKSYLPFPGNPSRTTTVRGAVGDFNGDGVADLAFVTGPGTTTNIRVVDGKTGTDLVGVQPVFGPFFIGGAFVTTSDFDGDGKAELVVTPDAGGGPRVRVFSVGAGGLNSRADFFSQADTAFRGGVQAAAGDMTGDGAPELLVAAGVGGKGRVAIFDMSKLSAPTPMIREFTADSRSINGVSLAVGDLNRDGYGDLIFGGGPGNSPTVTALDGKQVLTSAQDAIAAPIANFAAFDARGRGGVRLAIKDLDGDGKADLITGSGEGPTTQMRGFRQRTTMLETVSPDTFLDPFATVRNGPRLATGVFVG